MSWVKLEGSLESLSLTRRIAWMRDNHFKLIYSSVFFRILFNLMIVSIVFYKIQAKAGQYPEGNAWLWLIWCFVTVIAILLFSEAIPHFIAKYLGTKLIVQSYHPLRVIHVIVLPITYLMSISEPLIKRLLGLKNGETNGKEEKQEELLNVVEEGQKEGVVDEQEREMITSVLEFRDTTVDEIMTPRTEIIAIDIRMKFVDMVDMVVNSRHSRYPVYEESIDKIEGLIYAKDVLRHLSKIQPSMKTSDIMRKPYFVPESKTLRDLLHDMQEQKIHIAVVLDEYGGTAGMVTFEDILEELVGDISDEFENPQTESIQKISEHVYEVDARYHVDELNDEYGMTIPEDEDYETVGGFAFAQLGCIPHEGESFVYDNMTFTIIGAEERRIKRLRIEITPKQIESPE